MNIKNIFFQTITLFGNIGFYLLVLIFTYIKTNKFMNLLIILIIALTLSVIIRIIYFKQRPNKAKTDTWWLRIYNSSFPSVHAIRVVVLAYFFTISYPHFIIIIFSWTLAIIVCYSRTYLKKHDWIDVSAGVLIGFLLSFLFF